MLYLKTKAVVLKIFIFGEVFQSDHNQVPLEEVSTLCRALGFFPTEKEVMALLSFWFSSFDIVQIFCAFIFVFW